MAELGSSRPAALADPVPELSSRPNATRTYRKMLRDDASVDVSMRAAKTPVLAAEFFMEPFSEAPEHLEQAEFADFNIFDGMTTPFPVSLTHIMTNMEMGSSVLEPVWEDREWAPKRTGANRRKYTMLRKLLPIPASTITEFQYDDHGGPKGIKHGAIRADNKVDEIEIPIEKLIIFPLNQDGGNLEGKSLLRTAYKHWYYKDNFYKIDGVQKERHGIGIPDIELPIGYTADDKTAAYELGRNLRTNEEAYIVRTSGMVVGFAKPEGNMVDVLESAVHHDNMIMKNVLVQFLNLGLEGAGGGRATSGSHLDMFIKSLKYMANMVCAYFNMFLVPRLIGYNFEVKPGQYPKMKVRNIGETRDLQMFAAALANLAVQGLITMDLDTEQWVRQNFDMPAKLGPRPTNTGDAASDSAGEVDIGESRGNGVGRERGSVPSTIRTGNVGVSDSNGGK